MAEDMKTGRFGSGRSTEGSAWIGAVAGLCAGVGLGKLLAELALLYYGNLSQNPLGLYGTTILTTNLAFIAVVVAGLTLIDGEQGEGCTRKKGCESLLIAGPLGWARSQAAWRACSSRG
jgi:hypothetical protein